MKPQYNEGPGDWQSMFAERRIFSVYFTINGEKNIVFYFRTLLYIKLPLVYQYASPAYIVTYSAAFCNPIPDYEQSNRYPVPDYVL